MNHLEPETPEAAESSPASDNQSETGLKEAVIAALKTVYDPEIPVDIYELGLIYELEVEASGSVSIQMTLTSPACPVAESLPGDVEARVRAAEGVTDVVVDLVWSPPWGMERMSEAARLQLGFDL
jgi:FeS assembly SUF system protein